MERAKQFAILVLNLTLLGAFGLLIETANAQVTLDWVSTTPGGGYMLETDQNGFIYVTSGVYLYKYDIAGNEIWAQGLDQLGGGRSIAAWLALDPFGNIIITGGSSAFAYNFLTQKWDSDGNLLWETITPGTWQAFRVATDDVGNSYVLGKSPSSLPDYVTVKYDPNGNLVWMNTFAPGTINRPYALAVTSNGDVAVTGESNIPGNGYDIATVVYKSDGTQHWMQTHSSTIQNGGLDAGLSVAFGPNNEVYVGGYSENNPSNLDFTLIKYDSIGNQVWLQDYNGPSNQFDVIIWIRVDSQGNIIVAGQSESDITTIKYDSDGNQLWLQQFDSGFGGEDLLTHMILGPDDSIYLTGGSGTLDILTLKYNSIGDMQWYIYYDVPNPFGFLGNAVSLDSQNGVLITAQNILVIRYVDATNPVELISFTAIQENDNIILKWSTATETNNQGFEIERKIGSEYKKIGYVSGSGTTTEIQNYFFIDNNITQGKILYKLKQIDFDGNFEYSNEVEIEVSLPLLYSLGQNYPNPFNPSTKIEFSIPQKSFVSLIVFDALGNEIDKMVNEELSQGEHNIDFEATNLTSGVYFYQLKTKDFVETKKMMLLR